MVSRSSHIRNTLTQVLHGKTSQVTTRLLLGATTEGQKAGLAMFGKRPSWIGVTQRDGKRHVSFAYAGAETVGEAIDADSILLRVNVDNELAQFSYSLDEGKTFQRFGTRAKLLFSWWKGARPALFTYTSASSASTVVDFDWLRVESPTRATASAPAKFNRYALVSRHSPVPDSHRQIVAHGFVDQP